MTVKVDDTADFCLRDRQNYRRRVSRGPYSPFEEGRNRGEEGKNPVTMNRPECWRLKYAVCRVHERMQRMHKVGTCSNLRIAIEHVVVSWIKVIVEAYCIFTRHFPPFSGLLLNGDSVVQLTPVILTATKPG